MNRYRNWFTYKLYSRIFHYDERKYWKRRFVVTDPNNKTPIFIKLLLLLSLKNMEAHNAASLGTALNSGAKFLSVPRLPHGIAGVFISHSAQIGENCLILQNVTIGSSHGKAPIIGDNVIIGANACIIGGCRIGNNCKIGAGCTVFKDVPDNTTVVCHEPRMIEKSFEEAQDYNYF